MEKSKLINEENRVYYLSEKYTINTKEEKRTVEEGKGKNKKEVEIIETITTYDFALDYVGLPANLKEETRDIFKSALKSALETRAFDNLTYKANVSDTLKREEINNALKTFIKEADINKDFPALTNSDKAIINTFVNVILGAKRDGKTHTFEGIEDAVKAMNNILPYVDSDKEIPKEDLHTFKVEAEKFATFKLVPAVESPVFRKWNISISEIQIRRIADNTYGKLKWKDEIRGNMKTRPYAIGQAILSEVLRKTFSFIVPEAKKAKEIVAD